MGGIHAAFDALQVVALLVGLGDKRVACGQAALPRVAPAPSGGAWSGPWPCLDQGKYRARCLRLKACRLQDTAQRHRVALPLRSAMICAAMDTAVSSGLLPPMSRPMGAWI